MRFDVKKMVELFIMSFLRINFHEKNIFLVSQLWTMVDFSTIFSSIPYHARNTLSMTIFRNFLSHLIYVDLFWRKYLSQIYQYLPTIKNRCSASICKNFFNFKKNLSKEKFPGDPVFTRCHMAEVTA